MPKQITAETTPAEIQLMAQEYQELLSKSNVPMKLEQTIADMERRAAEMNKMTVEDWRTKFNAAPAAEPAPAGKATAKKKSDRGTVTEIDKDYFFIEAKNAAKSATWMKLRKELNIVMNMLITGPSGCGKTELVKRLGKEYGLPVYKVDCASITTPDKWVGHKELIIDESGQQVTQYVKSQFLQWLAAEDCEPGIVLLDEINRLNANLLNTTIPILDGSESIWIPDLGIYSRVHPETMIAATANLGVGYSGTHGLDIAFHDRFGAILEATFPPADEEVKVLMRRTGIDEARAKILVDIANQARSRADRGDVLSKYVSTRSLIDCGFWVRAGQSILDAAETTFIKKFSAEGGAESERAAITLMVKGLAGDK